MRYAQHIAHLGCDMHYPKIRQPIFTGQVPPDPLRDDISLTSLEASSARFYALAHQQGTQIWNFSTGIAVAISTHHAGAFLNLTGNSRT